MSESANRAVFLSYASQDADAARRICEALRAAGVEVWFDQSELRGGDSWDAKIRKQIKDCALFIPVISANTQARREGYFRLEWRLADQRTHLMSHDTPFVMPVVIDDTRDHDARVPESFLAVQWTRLPGGQVAGSFCERVSSLLTGGEEPNRRSQEQVDREPRATAERSGFGHNSGARKRRRLFLLLLAGAVITVFIGFGLQPKGRSGQLILRPSDPAVSSAENSQLIERASSPAVAALLTRARALASKTDIVRSDLDTAVTLLEEATKREPTNARLWAELSLVDWRYVDEYLDRSMGRIDSARRHAAQAVGIEPGNSLARLAQAAALAAGQRDAATMQRAIQILEPVVDRISDRSDGLYLLASLQSIDAALETLARAARIPGEMGRAERSRAVALFRAGRMREADRAADNALAAERSVKALLFKAYIHVIWHGDVAAAERLLTDVPSDAWGEDYAASARYFIELWAGKPERALGAIRAIPREFIESFALSGPTGYYRGYALARANKPAAAETEWRSALAVVQRELVTRPNDQTLLTFSALLQWDLGDQVGALKVWQSIRELTGGRLISWENFFLQMTILPAEEAIAKLESLGPYSTFTLAAGLQLNPYLDRLRQHPRFVALQAKRDADPTASPHAGALSGAVSDPKSVAVLAFDNLSDDKANEYFSDGISEELLMMLQKIPGLRLAARTSAFSFKGKQATVREVGEKLGVAHVVEGSVQKIGNRVKITVRLSRASTNEELWAKTFAPMELTDVFAIQSEIAKAVVIELRGQLTGVEATTTTARIAAQIHAAEIGGTRNIEAHELHLRGKFFANQFSLESLRRAEDVLRRAVALDPAFGQAWASLAKVGRLRSGFESTRAGTEAGFELAREASARAVELAPNLTAAHLARLHFELLAFDWKGALESLRRVKELSPDEAYSSEVRVAGVSGERERAIAAGQHAIALDPVNPELRVSYGWALLGLRRFGEAEAEFRRAAELSPTAPYGHAGAGIALLLQGRAVEATSETERESTDWTRRFALALTHWGEHRRAESDAALEELVRSNADTAAYQIVQVYAFRGESDRSFEWLERALRQRDPGLMMMKTDLLLDTLHDDARWSGFLRKIGLSEDQLK